MVNAGGFLAHLVKLVITIFCMKYLGEAYSILTLRAFQIHLVHSIIGMFRFGGTSRINGKRSFQNFYVRFSNIVEIISFAIFASEISRRCEVEEILRQSLLFVLSLLSLVHEIVPVKERAMIRTLINHAINLQLIIITIACFNRGSLSVVNLVISYIFNRYFAESFCEWFDIPYDDLIQYSFCFVEIFSLTTLKEL